MSRETRFCPNCGSEKVEPDTSNRAMQFFAGGDPNQWKCRECGYTGLMPLGDPEKDFEPGEEDEIEFEPGDRYPREDLSFGKGYLKYLLYVVIPFTVLYLVYLTLI